MNTTPDADASVSWYAEALATVHHFRLREPSDVAAHLRVTPAEWTAIDDAWTAALTASGVLLAPEVVLSFASTFARARRRLAQGHEQPSPLRELPTYLRRPPPTCSAVTESLTAPAPAAHVGPPLVPDGHDTVVPATLVSTPVLPFAVADERRPTFARCAMPEPVEARRSPDGHETSVLGAFVPGAALPFGPPELGAIDGDATMMLSVCRLSTGW